MSQPFDLVIRGGTLADGTGAQPFAADVAISRGRIAAVGDIAQSGKEEIDAKGLLVTPGFVDLHTHLDGHVTWENRLKPNTGHGVTTAIIGNCGVGFAPCRPQDRDMLVRMMETVEDIPYADLKKGLPWDWETYPEYIEALGRRRYNMDIGTLVPHSTLRAYVMGERALSGEIATDTDLTTMAGLTRDAIRAGALGFGSSTLTDQKTSDGRHIPSFGANENEFLAITRGMAEAGAGLLQIAFEFNEFPGAVDELEMLVRVAKQSGRPLTFSLKQSNSHTEGWRELLAISDRANREGAVVYPQVFGRPTGAVLSFAGSLNPFVRCPAFRPLGKLPLAEKLAELRRPELRAKLIEEEKQFPLTTRSDGFSLFFPLIDPPNYEQPLEESIEMRARAQNISGAELAYDYLLQDEGQAMLLLAGGNYADYNLEPSFEMLKNAHAVPGLGDGGAHSAIVCDASISTYMLSYWTRDRTRGGRLPLTYAVKLLTQDSANAIGLRDRGVIKPGYKADINVIDYANLKLRAPRLNHDLPAGGARLTQAAEGYVATIVSGEIVHRDDRETDRLPGKVIRGAQPLPA
ncbi:MAG: amidohydrolase family protein [Spongiibacteraceae bacterium]